MYYLGKKKRHTLKSQLLIDGVSSRIICTSFSGGQVHDFSLFKSCGIDFNNDLLLIGDSGYQGIDLYHKKSITPRKKLPKRSIPEFIVAYNRSISCFRVLIERVIGAVKFFRIVREVYRNRRGRFNLRFNILCGIYNWELAN